jgi:hypothetical protein
MTGQPIKIGLLQSRYFVCLLPLFFVVCAYSQAPQTVQLTIDYNDGIQKQFVLPFKSGMTVFDAMTAAKTNPHDGLDFDCDKPRFPCDAAPPNRMLFRIDDVKNQGGGSSAKNWQFWVNTVYSGKGFGDCKIAASDQILWKFDTFHGQTPGNACR